MSNIESKMSPKVMSFTELLDEYLQVREHKNNLPEDEMHRFVEVVYEIDVRCSPKNIS